ncbi:hypothetical protein Ahy_A06g028286 [Arachis hypogaea]|uniref:Uncharacterized protein n=1 Tax=Arachis hypogaea TaxID=3818 RepID=A0A445CQQ5_ARAHY|nr:hypothetical protein Ahy_A06g028286 [Arachis hypogaea]
MDLVLKENSDYKRPPENHASITPSSASSRGSGYGFADKGTPPMASVSIGNLLLYTTNDSWEVVNLKEAREFSRLRALLRFMTGLSVCLNRGDVNLKAQKIVPCALPPFFASQTVIDCQPLMIHLQEEACLGVSSFLADRSIVNSGDILPDSSVNSLFFTLSVSGLDLMVLLDKAQLDISKSNTDNVIQTSFAGARLHIEDFSYIDSPSMKLRILKTG